MTESCARGVLRDHVTGQIDGDISQTAFGVSSSHDTSTCDGAEGKHIGLLVDIGGGRILMIRHEEGLDGCALEAELATPRHVLNAEERAIGKQNHVKCAVTDDNVLCCVDDMGQDSPRRRIRGVCAVYKHILGGTCFPSCLGVCMNRSFNILTVEVQGTGSSGAVLEWESVIAISSVLCEGLRSF